MRAGSQADIEREVMDVARALMQRGSSTESIALLRAALARDASQVATRVLLDQTLAGAEVGGPSTTVELGYGLVDGWIRRGMLVEALALLGGTSLGDREKGREWANLLGELLAPVPVDAEAVLQDVHRQLLTGGASVALTLLEERDRKAPPMAAWAKRRMDLLRWMLLDNAEVLDHFDPLEDLAPSELAAALGVLERRGLIAGLGAVKELVERQPDYQDARRALEAIETLVASLEEEASRIGASMKTMPMVGHTAALMQVRMGNLRDAVGLYERILEHEDDERATILLGEIDVLIRALEGQEIDDLGTLDGEITLARGAFLDEPTIDERMPDLGKHGVTKETRLPDWPAEAAPEESGKHMVLDLETDPGDDGATVAQPSADQRAEALVAEGRLEEAEEIYRSLFDISPRQEWRLRADELRRQRLAGGAVSGDVLVRVILPVK